MRKAWAQTFRQESMHVNSKSKNTEDIIRA